MTVRRTLGTVPNFAGSFTQQEPIPQGAVDAAEKVMRHGRLHRYNLAEGEVSEVSLLESEFAKRTGAKYCLAVTSCGYALSCAIRAMGVQVGEQVLTNAFTLAPVPGAIAGIGAKPVLVDMTQELVIDFADLERKISGSDASVLVLSHMRGHICDMDALMTVCDRLGIRVIEDCAHTMGARWNGVPSGRHGLVGCYSTQTYKHVNSGEGGLLVTDDPQVMANAVVGSGSYMFFDRHLAAPPEDCFGEARYNVPNCSGRMDNLRAAILRPQLTNLETQCRRWNERYRTVEAQLRECTRIRLIERSDKEEFVGSSIQFLLPAHAPAEIDAVVRRCGARGVEIKWFGRETPSGFTSRYDSWRYIRPQKCPNTDRVLRSLLDMRLPLTFTLEDCKQIGRIIREEVEAGPEGRIQAAIQD